MNIKKSEKSSRENMNAKNTGQRNHGTAPTRSREESRSELRPVTKSKPQHKVPSVHH